MDDAVHSVGFEPTSTNTFELESNPLDRSGTNAGEMSRMGTSPQGPQHTKIIPVPLRDGESNPGLPRDRRGY